MLAQGAFLFETCEKIGQGGLGEVYKIRVTRSNSAHRVGSFLALKRMSAKWLEDPTALSRFEREIAMLKQMAHPNIISLEGEDITGQGRFYVMPLFGNTLRGHIASGAWAGNVARVAGCGAVLAEALHYAHTHRGHFVHRDLKPENILFNNNGPLVIADWGIGKFVHQYSVVLTQLTRGGMGTEYYCSGEQWATGEGNARSDVYSLGMLLDEWASGFQRDLMLPGCGIQADALQASDWRAVRWNQLLREMTSMVADRRPSSMAVIARRLRALA